MRTLQESLIEFVAVELGVNPARLLPNTRLNHDLGVDGDDGFEFVTAFSRRFGVDISDFEDSKYFGPEGGGNLFVWLWWFVNRKWPKFVPITLNDLQTSIQEGRWITEEHNAV